MPEAAAHPKEEEHCLPRRPILRRRLLNAIAGFRRDCHGHRWCVRQSIYTRDPKDSF